MLVPRLSCAIYLTLFASSQQLSRERRKKGAERTSGHQFRLVQIGDTPGSLLPEDLSLWLRS